ncbi:MAG: hypothetical protein AAFN68_05345, partial [Pseudomonadota bacterium]
LAIVVFIFVVFAVAVFVFAVAVFVVVLVIVTDTSVGRVIAGDVTGDCCNGFVMANLALPSEDKCLHFTSEDTCRQIL